jgi:hypothetical protein
MNDKAVLHEIKSIIRTVCSDAVYFSPTETGLNKSILDATSDIRAFFKSNYIHDFELQDKGPDYKVEAPTLFIREDSVVETKTSLYRPVTKDGDPRMWLYGLKEYCSVGDEIALIVCSKKLLVVNCSDENVVSSILNTTSPLFDVFNDIEDTPLSPELEMEDRVEPVRYTVSSFGWDVDVEGLVKRLNRGDIFVPSFQRGFVWSGPEKSRFIESLILGLPVPTIFLALDSNSKEYNIIDGQQRLKTLQSYINGEFVLSGKNLSAELKGCYFSSEVAKSKTSRVLSRADLRALSDAALHAVVIRSGDVPITEYYDSIIQIFKRLNTSGKPLLAQEVRASIFHGPLLLLLNELNQLDVWRNLFGNIHSRMKDVEAILRTLALYSQGSEYKSPMPRFLDSFMETFRLSDNVLLDELKAKFIAALHILSETEGNLVFKSGGTFKLTKLDSLVVGLMSTFEYLPEDDHEVLKRKFYEKVSPEMLSNKISNLEADDSENGYQWSIAEFVNDTNRVTTRIECGKRFLKIG